LNIPVRKRKGEAGQAILLVVVAMGIFLLGATGLAIDASNMYAQRQQAQAAADASAVAGIMSIFDGSNTIVGNTHGFSIASGTTYTCSSSDAKTPCYYAQTLNGFNTANDTVKVTANPSLTIPSLSSDPINLLQVTVSRQVTSTLMKFITSWNPTITATATGAIVNVVSPIPIIITHPSMASALNANGTTGITITGGPSQSIQINSTNSAAYAGPSSGSVDLSHAGPTNNGGNFGVFGGPSTNPGNVNLGTLPGKYLSPSSPILDPLASVAAPSVPATTPPSGGQSCTVLGHCGDCPAPGFSGSKPATCTEFLPGTYSSLDATGINSAIFDPGIYFIKGGGFTLKNDTVAMCTSCAQDATTKSGMLIYDTCSTATTATPCAAGSDSTGGFTVDTNANAELLGAGVNSANPTGSPASPYYGILFFEDRNADAHTGNGAHGAHHLGQGNGCFSLIGTIYITNWLSIMQANASHYQEVRYNGTPCTGVQNYGEIIVSELSIVGTSGINMGLFPNSFLTVRQIALVQ
jgi:Putative Flp pilus-assembly TadE/G-like